MAPRKRKRKVNKTEILLELQKIIESKKSPGRHISDADFKLLGIQLEIPQEDIKKVFREMQPIVQLENE